MRVSTTEGGTGENFGDKCFDYYGLARKKFVVNGYRESEDVTET